MPGGGMSMLAGATRPVSLRDAIRAAPETMLGAELAAAHGAEFRVLVKILDPGEPIVFHLHATDAQVQGMPQHFRGHRFGKDEAYYFLDCDPKGPVPYTHAGLHEGVTRRDLSDALRRGPRHALELSPSFHQECGYGFFVPAGVPHRPGTALTLEVQQPSDVYTLLSPMSARQMHPGFKSIDEAFELIDIEQSHRVGKLTDNRLTPATERAGAEGEVATIFPEEVCRKFAGRRVRVSGSMTYAEPTPFVLLVWRGRGTLNGRRAARGDEFFVAFDAARQGVEVVNAGDEVLEIFTFFPVVGSNRMAPPRVH
jgi:mannose-6-phosphate isomerase class I